MLFDNKDYFCSEFWFGLAIKQSRLKGNQVRGLFSYVTYVIFNVIK